MGVLIIRILLFRVLYQGPLSSERGLCYGGGPRGFWFGFQGGLRMLGVGTLHCLSILGFRD